MKIGRNTSRGAESNSAQMTLMEHLGELRNRLLWIVGTVIILAIVAYLLFNRIYDFMVDPYCRAIANNPEMAARSGLQSGDCQLFFTGLVDGFMLRMKASGYTALIFAMPVILFHLWRFIAPGLYRNERRYTIAFVALSMVLFAFGAALAYWTMQMAFAWLSSQGGPGVTLASAPDYFWLVAIMMLAFGAGFEFPVVLIALQMMGMVSNERLRSWRRQAAIVILAIVAFITPGGDPFSLTALAVPMYLFYEVSILFGRIHARRKVAASTS